MLPNDSTSIKKIEKEKPGLFSRFSKSESAAATAVIAVLLLGLVFTIISVVRLEYVPEWKDDAEQNHVYDIWDDMLGVKVRIDILSGLMDSGNYPANDFSATVPFDMGGGEVSVFEPSKSNGELELNTERCAITITPYSSTDQKLSPYTVECGGISCYSESRQYPDQIFRYENGALILADGKSSIIKQPPIFTIEENETKNGNYTVGIRTVQLLGKVDSMSSNTITPLQLTGWGSKPVYNSNEDTSISVKSFDLTIATKYPDAWLAYFNEYAQDKWLKKGTDYNVEYIPDSGSVRFSFLPSSSKKLERLYVSKAMIRAEITPLRYENVMKLNKWYSFDTASDKGINLFPLSDYDSDYDLTIDLPTQDVDQPLSGYSGNNLFEPNDLKDNPIESTFGFSGFTEFESQPSSVTILIIYQFPDLDSLPDMNLAGETLPKLVDNNKNWYLYKHTIFAASINDPSDLEFNLKIAAQNKRIDIDYLAVRLN